MNKRKASAIQSSLDRWIIRIITFAFVCMSVKLGLSH